MSPGSISRRWHALAQPAGALECQRHVVTLPYHGDVGEPLRARCTRGWNSWESTDYWLVLHSDGVTSHWGWSDFPQLAQESATGMAQIMLRVLAKENDDATVVVVRDRLP